MEADMIDYYELLGVDPNASRDEIRRAYRRLIKDAHPDRPGGCVDRARALEQARKVLLDPIARAQYDAQRAKHELVDDTIDALAGVAERALGRLTHSVTVRGHRFVGLLRARSKARSKC